MEKLLNLYMTTPVGLNNAQPGIFFQFFLCSSRRSQHHQLSRKLNTMTKFLFWLQATYLWVRWQRNKLPWCPYAQVFFLRLFSFCVKCFLIFTIIIQKRQKNYQKSSKCCLISGIHIEEIKIYNLHKNS